MKKSLKWPRILTIAAGFMLIGALVFPIWQIELSAPQYPEGLVLKIGADGLHGDVDIINGLNHYIGMRTMHSEDFIEFKILPYMLGGLIVLAFLAGLINRKKFYYFYIALFMLLAIVSFVDFYKWEYDYGHNLDPNAAIKVPGMSYQPPLIGFKQLLNFGAYSIPDIGGWFFIGTGVVLLVAYLLLLQPKWLPFGKTRTITVSILAITLFSCSSGPQPINYGRDACDFCKMTIVDKKFACQWVNDKGKTFPFDDVHCLLSDGKLQNTKGTAYINDYGGEALLLPADKMFFVRSEALQTPMGGKMAAFSTQADAAAFLKTNPGQQLTWQEVNAQMKSE